VATAEILEAVEGEGLTIDALARASGTTTRNIRALQTRGLLAPPTVVARVGRYGRVHLERLRLIARLQDRGYSLAAIADVLEAWHERRSVSDLLGFERELDLAEGVLETELEFGLDELAARFPGIDDALVHRAIELELVVVVSWVPPRVRVPSPRLLEVGRALMDLGIPLAVALDQLVVLRDGTGQMAKALVAMFAEHVITPWAAAGHPVEAVPELLDRVRRTKPLPLVAVTALMRKALEREVATVLSTIIPRHG
jgi:DNA-binding transcriptional MerR regulator